MHRSEVGLPASAEILTYVCLSFFPVFLASRAAESICYPIGSITNSKASGGPAQAGVRRRGASFMASAASMLEHERNEALGPPHIFEIGLADYLAKRLLLNL